MEEGQKLSPLSYLQYFFSGWSFRYKIWELLVLLVKAAFRTIYRGIQNFTLFQVSFCKGCHHQKIFMKFGQKVKSPRATFRSNHQ